MSHVDETHWHLLKPWDVVRCGKDADPSVWLGRIVQNFNSPLKGYVSPSGVIGVNSRSKDSHAQSDGQVFRFVDDPDFTDVQGLIDQARSTKSRVQLSELFLDLFKISKSSENPSFTSQSVRRLRVEQEDDAITNILNDAAVHEKLEKWVPVGKQAYLIAAILVTEAEVSYDDNSSIEKGSNFAATIPAPVVSAAASALTSAPVVVQNPVSVNHAQSETASTNLKTTIKGQNIIAIDYRVLDRPGFRVLSKISGSRKAVQATKKPPRGGRFFGHHEVVVPDQEVELPKIEVRRDPLYYFESTAAPQSFALVSEDSKNVPSQI